MKLGRRPLHILKGGLIKQRFCLLIFRLCRYLLLCLVMLVSEGEFFTLLQIRILPGSSGEFELLWVLVDSELFCKETTDSLLSNRLLNIAKINLVDAF